MKKPSLSRMLWAQHDKRGNLLKSIRDEIMYSTNAKVYNFVELFVCTPVWQTASISVYDSIQLNLYNSTKK